MENIHRSCKNVCRLCTILNDCFCIAAGLNVTYLGQLIFNNMLISVPIIFLVFILASLILGRIDTLLGLREEELRNSSTSNPVMREILKKLEETKKELQEIKSKLSEEQSINKI